MVDNNHNTSQELIRYVCLFLLERENGEEGYYNKLENEVSSRFLHVTWKQVS